MMWEYEMAQTIKHTSVSSLELPRIKAFIAEYDRLRQQPDYYEHMSITAMDKNHLLASMIGYFDSIAQDLSE